MSKKLDFSHKEKIIRRGVQRKDYYIACASVLSGKKYYNITFSCSFMLCIISWYIITYKMCVSEKIFSEAH